MRPASKPNAKVVYTFGLCNKKAYYFTSAPLLRLILMTSASLQHLHTNRCKPRNRQDKHESSIKTLPWQANNERGVIEIRLKAVPLCRN